MTKLVIESPEGKAVGVAYEVPGYGPVLQSDSPELKKTYEALLASAAAAGLPSLGWISQGWDSPELRKSFDELLGGTRNEGVPFLGLIYHKGIGRWVKPGDECFLEALAANLACYRWRAHLEELPSL